MFGLDTTASRRYKCKEKIIYITQRLFKLTYNNDNVERISHLKI
jgi:hypothetical protein